MTKTRHSNLLKLADFAPHWFTSLKKRELKDALKLVEIGFAEIVKIEKHFHNSEFVRNACGHISDRNRNSVSYLIVLKRKA